MVTRRKKILRHYATTWMPLDFISSIPFDWFLAAESASSVRLVKTSKLAKLLKIFRVFKVFKLLKLMKVGVAGVYGYNTRHREAMQRLSC